MPIPAAVVAAAVAGAVVGAVVGSVFPSLGKGIRSFIGSTVEDTGDVLSKVGRFISGEENLTQEVGLFVNYVMDAKEKGKISKEEFNSLIYGLIYYLGKKGVENPEEFVLNAYEITKSQFAQAQENPDRTEELERTVTKITHAIEEHGKERTLGR